MDYWFYHLERSALADALPPLLEKARGKGWKALIRSTSEIRIAELDDALWTFAEESFLPHGRADKPGAARQPVLLSTDGERENAAELVILTDGAPAPTSLEGVERCVIMFSGDDEEAVHAARQTWKSLKAEGAALSYWRQTPDGGWREETR